MWTQNSSRYNLNARCGRTACCLPKARPRSMARTEGKRHGTQQSVDQAVKSICDVMGRGNCAGAMQYVPELTWLLFLRILDEREEREASEADALGLPFTASLESPYRWRDWAARDS